MAEAMRQFPPEMLETFGVADVTSPEGYLYSAVFNLMIPLLFLIFAATWGARAIAGDEETGALDLLLAHPVGRVRLLLERFAALAAGTAALGGLVVLLLVAVAPAAGLDAIPPGRLAAAVASLVLLSTCFGALAIATGGVTGSRAAVLAVTAGAGVVAYFANSLAPKVEAIEWLQKLSPFYHYLAGDPLRNGIDPGHAGVLLGITAALLLLAAVAFDRRDLRVA